MKNSYEVHQSLGLDGLKPVRTNEFGDTAMTGDIEAEKSVIKTVQESGLSMSIVSEEHGEVGFSEQPVLLGILDGIDGSALYKTAHGVGRYGTMFGVFNGNDPLYSDYIFGGVMEHSTRRLFYSVKGKGCFILDLSNNKTIFMGTSSVRSLDNKTRIYVDEASEFNQSIFMSKLPGYNVMKNQRCSALHYTSLILGEADLVLESTRKGNLEIAVTYGMIREAGGVAMSGNGEELANKKYRSFGQDKNFPIPVISAATLDLAKEAVQFFRG